MVAYFKLLFLVGGVAATVGIIGAIIIGFISAIFRATPKQGKTE